MSLTQIIKAAIESSGLTLYRIAKETKIDPSVLGRFMSGERDIQLSTAEKLVEFLEIEVSKRSPAGKRRRK